jgi:O-antigen/teichoic acid export membrane protein
MIYRLARQMNWFEVARFMRKIRTYAPTSLWVAAESLAPSATLLLLAPVFVSAVGVAGYGQWMLANAIAGIVGVVGAAFNIACIKTVASKTAQQEWTAARSTAETALAITALIGVATSVLVVTVGPTALGREDVLNFIYPYACGVLLLESLDSVAAGILKGAQLMRLSARIDVTGRMGGMIIGAAAAYLTHSLAAALLFLFISSAVRVIVRQWVCARTFGARLEMRVHKDFIRALYQIGGWSWLQNISGFLFGSLDRLVLGRVIGSEALGRFSLMIQISQLIHALPVAFLSVVFPLMSYRLGDGQAIKRRTVWEVLAINAAMVVALATSLLLAAGPITRIWLGSQWTTSDPTLFRAFCGVYSILGLCVGAHFLLLGAGRMRYVALVNLVGGILATIFLLSTITLFGIYSLVGSRMLYSVAILSLIPSVLARSPVDAKHC